MDIGDKLDIAASPWTYYFSISDPETNETRNVSIGLYSQLISLGLGWNTVILNGFNNETSFQSVPPVLCEIANCTWLRFTSLTICFSCTDITNHINQAFVNITDNAFYYIYSAIRYSLLYVSFAYHYNQMVNWNIGTLFIALNMTAYPWETFSFQNYTTMISSFTILRAAESFIQNKTLWNKSSPIAIECVLYYCINKYKLKLQNRLV